MALCPLCDPAHLLYLFVRKGQVVELEGKEEKKPPKKTNNKRLRHEVESQVG